MRVSLMELKVDSELFCDLAPQFDTYACQEPSAFSILNGGPTATPMMSFRLGIAVFSSGVGRFSSDGPAPFSDRVREHRTEKQIAGRRDLFIETNDRTFSPGG